MSRLALANGDDHPDAAAKHLADAATLLVMNRPDGAAYLSGYVVECSLKAVLQVETQADPPRHHNLGNLLADLQVATSIASARTARYLGRSTTSLAAGRIVRWRPELRYQGPSMTQADATTWLDEAKDIHAETVHQMRLDGVI